MKKVVLSLLLLCVLALPGCNGYEREILKVTDSLKMSLVESSYLSSLHEHEEGDWNASGGFFLIMGGFSASGDSEHSFKESRVVVVAVRLPSDGTVIILRLPAEKVRLMLSEEAYLEIIPKSGNGRRVYYEKLTTEEFIYYSTREYILGLPQGDIDVYIAAALSYPIRTENFGKK